jgi:aspartate racemase
MVTSPTPNAGSGSSAGARPQETAVPQRDPLVGVLGGMGPAATADFYTKLIRCTPATRDQDHLRVVIWADPTVPDRVAAVVDGSSDPYPAMLAGAEVLKSAGATLIAMPCNTAHVFLPRLTADTGLPFVDMIAEAVAAVGRQQRATERGRVALLGTRGLLASGIYQRQLAAAGIDPVLVGEPAQRQLDRAIANVKAGNVSDARHQLGPVLSELSDSGVSTVLLACSELPLAAAFVGPFPGLELLDPTELLAKAVVRRCRPE